MIKRYAHSIVAHPVWVILMSIFILSVAAIGIGKLSFKSDLRIYFEENDPQVMALDAIETTYTKTDNVFFMLAPRDGVFNQDTLEAVEELTDRAWQLPFSRRVDSLTNFMNSEAKGDEIVVEKLVADAATLSPEAIARIRELALQEPLIVNKLVSPDGEFTGVNVTVNIPKGQELSGVPQVAKAARALKADMEARYPILDIYLTGVVMMDTAFAESSEADMKTLVPAMLTFALIVVGVLMRSVTAAIVTLVVLVLSIVAAMGLSGWTGILLNPVSINAPNIILTIAIADCVHLLMAYFTGLREGLPKQQAMIESLTTTFKPIFLTTLSTALGFLTLNFSDAPPFRDLGNITFFGTIMAFIFTVSFLPALMMFITFKPKPEQSKDFLREGLEAFSNRMIANPKRYFIVTMALVGVSFAGLFNLTFNDEYVKYFDESVTFRQDTDFTADKLTGIYYAEYELANSTHSGINDPQYLKELDAFSSWLRQRNEVLHVNSIVDVYKKLNKNMHGDQDAMHTVPTNSDLAAQYLMLYEMSLPYGLDLRDRVNANYDASRVSVTLKNLSSTEVLQFEEAVQAWLATNTSVMQPAKGTGLTLMFADIGQRNTIAMIKGTFLASLLVSFMLIFAFRSVRYGLISLIPNILPALIAFGVWGMIVGQVGLALSVMSSMTLGIVVDDTIHFMTSYLHRRRALHESTQAALRYTFIHLGPALITTSLALTVGFAILGLSSFEINAGMGILTAIAIAIAMMLDLVLLPTALLLLDRDPVKAPHALSDNVDEAPSDGVLKPETKRKALLTEI